MVALKFPRSKRGMSLVEVMIAVAVLSVAILGVLSAIAFGLRSAAYGQRVTEATNLARQISETIRAQGHAYLSTTVDWYNTPAITQASFNNDIHKISYGAPFANIPDNGIYRRTINISQLGTGGFAGFEGYLYQIRVTVYFYERGSMRQVQMVSVARRPR